MSKILYFEYLLSSIDLASRMRELKLSQAQIGYSAGDNLDWKEDAAWEQAQRDFLLVGRRLAETKRSYGKHRGIIQPYRKPPIISTVQIGAEVLLDIDEGREKFLVGSTSEIDGGSRDTYQGRVSIDAPLGKKMNGISRGYKFSFRGSGYNLLDVTWGVPDYLEWYLPRFLRSNVSELKRLKSGSLDRGKLSSNSVRLMTLADRFRFLDMVSSAYPLVDLSLPGSPKGYERDIQKTLRGANLTYVPFTELAGVE